jgi:hypothetical protein
MQLNLFAVGGMCLFINALRIIFITTLAVQFSYSFRSLLTKPASIFEYSLKTQPMADLQNLSFRFINSNENSSIILFCLSIDLHLANGTNEAIAIHWFFVFIPLH